MRLLLLAAALVPARSMAGVIGAESPRRFLLLHGAGTSGGAFLSSPSARGAKQFLKGVPRRPDAGGAIPPNWIYSALDAGSADGRWFDDDYGGLDFAIKEVEVAIREQEAVGIIGHEQGATLAALVAARSSLGVGAPLKFAVVCGASMPAEDSPYAELLRRLRETAGCEPIPTLHCLGGAAGGAEAVAACFPNAELLRHDGGGAMPGPDWWAETTAFPERVTGGNRWVTQYGGPFYYNPRLNPNYQQGQPTAR